MKLREVETKDLKVGNVYYDSLNLLVRSKFKIVSIDETLIICEPLYNCSGWYRVNDNGLIPFAIIGLDGWYEEEI